MDDSDKQLDIPNEPSFVHFFNSLPSSPLTFRLFDRGDWWSVHGDNALYVAEHFLSTQKVIKYIGSQKLASVSLSQVRFEALMKYLVMVKHLRVEIYKSTKKKQQGSEWSLHCNCSPGKLGELEDLLYSSNEALETNGIVAIKYGGHHGKDGQTLGVAHVDNMTGHISWCQFVDNQYLSHLKALLVQLSPKECLIGKESSNEVMKKVIKILDENNILVSECKKSYFNADELEASLKILVDDKNIAFNALQDKEDAKSALFACINYLELTSQDSNMARFQVKEISLDTFVRLDASAVKSLELFPAASSDGISNRSNATLFQLLNKCKTIPGQRLLAQWIRQPLRDIDLINERLDLVEFFNENTHIRQSIQEHLRKIPDLSRLYRKLQIKKATLQDCYRIYLLLDLLPNMCNCMILGNNSNESEECLPIKKNFVGKMQDLMGELDELKETLERVIDLNRIEESGEYWINPEVDETLKQSHEELIQSENQANSIVKKVSRLLQLEVGKSIKLESVVQGFVFKISKNDEKGIRDKDVRDLFQIEQTKKDGVRFTNKELRNLNVDYKKAKNDYESQQKKFIDEVVSRASSFHPQIEKLGHILALLDAITSLAFASLVSPIQYTRPKLLPQGSGQILLKQVRHPCLELQDISFIPNDVSMNDDRKFLIITGPNMGGKSTYIRSVALCTLMAQIGSFVPAKSATISIVDGIFTRVGSSDHQIKGMSTFMAEMYETAAIFRLASSDSLIIIDELGRGTSTFDGFGLAWAISEFIAKELRSYTLFATHFHELTDLAKEVASVGNIHLKAMTTSESLTMLYQVADGICDQSYGIHVAQLANFPDNVIKMAKEKLKEYEGNGIDSVIDWNNEELVKDIIRGLIELPKGCGIEAVRSLIRGKINESKK